MEVFTLMTGRGSPGPNPESIRDTPPLAIPLPLETLKRNVWIVGMLSCCFWLFDRGIVLWVSNLRSPIDIARLSMVLFFSIGWLFFKPEGALGAAREALPYLEDEEPPQLLETFD
jgi:hypothetical protein